MSKRGRLEAQITVPTGGWDLELDNGTTSETVTIAAGTYYPTDFLITLDGELENAHGESYTVTGSFGEAGTGLVTIANTEPVNISITWTDTPMRDLLGFTGNVSGSASHTGTRNMRGVWLPDCSMAAKYGPNDAGHTESDMGQTISPRGDVQTMIYTTRVRNPSVLWSHVTRARARIQGETTVGSSFEQWFRYTQLGELSYFEPGAPVRLIWDADVSATYTTYRLVSKTSTEMERAVAEWCGLFPIEITGYVVP